MLGTTQSPYQSLATMLPGQMSAGGGGNPGYAPNLMLARSLMGSGGMGGGMGMPRGVSPNMPTQQPNPMQQAGQGGSSLLGQLLAKAKQPQTPGQGGPTPPPQMASNGMPLPSTANLPAPQILAAPQNAPSQMPNGLGDPGALSSAQLMQSQNPGIMGGMWNPQLTQGQSFGQGFGNQTSALSSWLGGLFGGGAGGGGGGY